MDKEIVKILATITEPGIKTAGIKIQVCLTRKAGDFHCASEMITVDYFININKYYLFYLLLNSGENSKRTFWWLLLNKFWRLEFSSKSLICILINTVLIAVVNLKKTPCFYIPLIVCYNLIWKAGILVQSLLVRPSDTTHWSSELMS